MKTAVWLLLMVAAPALAQERPQTTPSRDVAVVYRMGAGERTIEERYRFHAADQRARLDVGPDAYMLSDLRAHTATMVVPHDRAAVQMPMPALDVAGLGGGQSFRKLGALTVAGVPCTEWQTADIKGQPVIACLSGDGVMLRARRGEQVMVEATAVSFDPQDPAAFAVPAGYQRVSPAPR